MLGGKFEGSEDDGTAGRDVNGKAVSPVMLLVTFVDTDPLIIGSVESLETTIRFVVSLVKDHMRGVPVCA